MIILVILKCVLCIIVAALFIPTLPFASNNAPKWGRVNGMGHEMNLSCVLNCQKGSLLNPPACPPLGKSIVLMKAFLLDLHSITKKIEMCYFQRL